MLSVVLFGAGSPIIVDVEQSCARRGWSIAARVKNLAGPVYSGLPPLVVAAADLALAD